MRYVFYFFTLALVFTAGMFVGNLYVPARNASLATAVSVPELDSSNPALATASEENAQQALGVLTQALSACPVVVPEEQALLFNRISLFLTLKDFQVKKAIYEAEIAKNIETSKTTAQFSRAAADYSAAKTRVEQQADELFPPQPEPAVQAETSTEQSPAELTQSSTTTATN